MDYLWMNSVPQFGVTTGYDQYQQYPHPLAGYESYFSGNPWMPGHCASMYQYDMNYTSAYQQESQLYPLDGSPPAKKICMEDGEDLSHISDNNPDLIDISNDMASSVVDSSHMSTFDRSVYDYSYPSGNISLAFDFNFANDSQENGPLTSTLTHPISFHSIKEGERNISSPDFPHIDMSWLEKPVPEYIDEQPIAQALLYSSQISYTDATELTPWAQEVPKVFATYREPMEQIIKPTSIPKPKGRSRPCKICSEIFATSYKLKVHMESHRGTGPSVCTICGKSFAREASLNTHKRIHTGEKPYPCIRCGKGFSHPSDRLGHLVTEVCIRVERYIRRTGKGWECTSCEKDDFVSRDQAERHARQHQTGQAKLCPVCKLNFTCTKSNYIVKHVKENHPEYFDGLNL